MTVELVFGSDGQIVSLDTVQSAGVPGFDDAAKEVLRDSVPFPWADVDLRSDDGLVHLRWTFARDQRRCSGVTLLHFEEPLAIALPKLIRDGREEEALRRMRRRARRRHADRSDDDHAGLRVDQGRRRPPERHGRGRRHAGDAGRQRGHDLAQVGGQAPRDGAGRRPRAGGPPRADLPDGRVDARLGRSVGVGVNVASTSAPKPAAPAAAAKPPTPAEQLTAAIALATAGEAECAPGLIALLEDHKARTDTRVAAAVALGAIANDEATKKALAGAAKDDVVAVRAAATLAGARPGSGRGKVFALVTPLRDPSPEMRAAAAAGIVRAGGDSNLTISTSSSSTRTRAPRPRSRPSSITCAPPRRRSCWSACSSARRCRCSWRRRAR